MKINKSVLIDALKGLDVIIHDIENNPNEKPTTSDELCQIFNKLYLEFIKNGGNADEITGNDDEDEKNERLLYIQSLYDEWLQKTEKRGISYGEIAHIQGLNDGELDEIEKELLKELERLNNEDKTN